MVSEQTCFGHGQTGRSRTGADGPDGIGADVVTPCLFLRHFTIQYELAPLQTRPVQTRPVFLFGSFFANSLRTNSPRANSPCVLVPCLPVYYVFARRRPDSHRFAPFRPVSFYVSLKISLGKAWAWHVLYGGVSIAYPSSFYRSSADVFVPSSHAPSQLAPFTFTFL